MSDRIEVLTSDEEAEVEKLEEASLDSTVPRPDEEVEKAPENSWDAERVKSALEEAANVKSEANSLYAQGALDEARQLYSRCIDLTEGCQAEKARAVFFANRAACHLADNRFAEAESDCDAALKLDAAYQKCYLRRAKAREGLDNLAGALADYKSAGADHEVRRLEPIVKEQQERQQKEMLDQLKGLGNSILGKFGLSLDNFNLQKDESSGSYSVQFNQGNGGGGGAANNNAEDK